MTGNSDWLAKHYLGSLKLYSWLLQDFTPAFRPYSVLYNKGPCINLQHQPCLNLSHPTPTLQCLIMQDTVPCFHTPLWGMTVSCKLRAKTPNKAKDNNSEVTRRTTTAKPVRRCRRKKNQSPSALARSRKRHTRFLEKKLAGKPDLAMPEEKSITTVPGFPDAVDSLCVKELENTSPVGGSSRDLVSLEDPTSSPDSDPDLSINERAILRKFLDTVNTDSEDSDDDLSSVHCASCKRLPEKGEELKRCLRCHIARYFSVQCQRKDWDFHRFACSVVAKRSDTVKA